MLWLLPAHLRTVALDQAIHWQVQWQLVNCGEILQGIGRAPPADATDPQKGIGPVVYRIDRSWAGIVGHPAQMARAERFRTSFDRARQMVLGGCLARAVDVTANPFSQPLLDNTIGPGSSRGSAYLFVRQIEKGSDLTPPFLLGGSGYAAPDMLELTQQQAQLQSRPGRHDLVQSRPA